MKVKNLLSVALGIIITASAMAQTDSTAKPVDKKHEEKKTNWYDKISIRGYSQIRYNRLLETNPDLGCEQCDKSWGNNNGIFLRRGRLILFGQLNEHVYMYIQPDFASAASTTSLHFFQLRDAYFDISVDKKKEFRFRIGQSKIPYGFENLQSSQNRLSLDRNDAFNSALSNERDLAGIFYWAPEKIRKRFSSLVNDGLKGSGDYGVFALGVFNGQTANKPEVNNNLHIVSRLTYPMQFKNGQILEVGAQAYSGKVVVTSLTKGVKGGPEFDDQRLGGSLILYPKPIGVQVEYTVGKGPEYDVASNSIMTKNLEGGYALINYKLDLGKHTIFPFVKGQYYQGGKKHELDARRYVVHDYEFGIEWQPFKQMEVVAMYTMSDRVYEDAVKTANHQVGNLLRLQVQINY